MSGGRFDVDFVAAARHGTEIAYHRLCDVVVSEVDVVASSVTVELPSGEFPRRMVLAERDVMAVRPSKRAQALHQHPARGAS
jgi:hypothetical protein